MSDDQQSPSAESFDQLLESIMAAASPSPSSSAMVNDANSVSGTTSTHMDDWLAMLNAFPPGAPDDVPSDLDSVFDSIFAEASDLAPTTTTPSGTSVCSNQLMIDPALLSSESTPRPSDAAQSSSDNALLNCTSRGPSKTMTPGMSTLTCSNPARPPTPTLVGSPLASASSLAADPPTPDWNWGILDPDTGQDVHAELEVATAETAEQGASSSHTSQGKDNEPNRTCSDELSELSIHVVRDTQCSQTDAKGKGKEKARDDVLDAATVNIQESSKQNPPLQQIPQSHVYAPAPLNPATPTSFLMQPPNFQSRPPSQQTIISMTHAEVSGVKTRLFLVVAGTLYNSTHQAAEWPPPTHWWIRSSESTSLQAMASTSYSPLSNLQLNSLRKA